MNLIKERLNSLKKNQVWLSQKTGISKFHINKIIQDKVDPKLSTAHRISSILQCRVEDLWIFD